MDRRSDTQTQDSNPPLPESKSHYLANLTIRFWWRMLENDKRLVTLLSYILVETYFGKFFRLSLLYIVHSRNLFTPAFI
jgi:hypothetical protein